MQPRTAAQQRGLTALDSNPTPSNGLENGEDYRARPAWHGSGSALTRHPQCTLRQRLLPRHALRDPLFTVPNPQPCKSQLAAQRGTTQAIVGT